MQQPESRGEREISPRLNRRLLRIRYHMKTKKKCRATKIEIFIASAGGSDEEKPADQERGPAEGHATDEQWKEGEALLDHLSFPPTDEELSQLQALTPAQLPPKYTRGSAGRVFVNRSLRLDRISWIGCASSRCSRA